MTSCRSSQVFRGHLSRRCQRPHVSLGSDRKKAADPGEQASALRGTRLPPSNTAWPFQEKVQPWHCAFLGYNRRASGARRNCLPFNSRTSLDPMPVPISQAWSVATYVLKQKLRGRKRYPFVLMLEPLFRCNLACAGCGKIQYPAHILKKELSPE